MESFLETLLQNRTCILIAGISGVGKTTLAEHIVLALKKKQPNLKVVVENPKTGKNGDYTRRGIKYELSRSLVSKKPEITPSLKRKLKNSIFIVEDQPRMAQHEYFQLAREKLSRIMTDPMYYRCVPIVITQDLKQVPKEWLGHSKILCLFKIPKFHPMMFRPAISPAVAGDILTRIENYPLGYYAIINRYDDTISSKLFWRTDVSELITVMENGKLNGGIKLGVKTVTKTSSQKEEPKEITFNKYKVIASTIQEAIGFLRLIFPPSMPNTAISRMLDKSFDYVNVVIMKLKNRGLLPQKHLKYWTKKERIAYLRKYYQNVKLVNLKTEKTVGVEVLIKGIEKEGERHGFTRKENNA